MSMPQIIPYLTETQIRTDNPHFGPKIRLIDEGPCNNGGYLFRKTVAAEGSRHAAEPGVFFDAWATYLWSPIKKEWVLGAN